MALICRRSNRRIWSGKEVLKCMEKVLNLTSTFLHIPIISYHAVLNEYYDELHYNIVLPLRSHISPQEHSGLHQPWGRRYTGSPPGTQGRRRTSPERSRWSRRKRSTAHSDSLLDTSQLQEQTRPRGSVRRLVWIFLCLNWLIRFYSSFSDFNKKKHLKKHWIVEVICPMLYFTSQDHRTKQHGRMNTSKQQHHSASVSIRQSDQTHDRSCRSSISLSWHQPVDRR